MVTLLLTIGGLLGSADPLVMEYDSKTRTTDGLYPAIPCLRMGLFSFYRFFNILILITAGFAGTLIV